MDELLETLKEIRKNVYDTMKANLGDSDLAEYLSQEGSRQIVKQLCDDTKDAGKKLCDCSCNSSDRTGVNFGIKAPLTITISATLCKECTDELWETLNPLLQLNKAWYRIGPPGSIKEVKNARDTKRADGQCLQPDSQTKQADAN